MTRSGVECVALVVGLAVAVGLYVWHGGRYPLPVDLVVVATAGIVAYIAARELGLWGCCSAPRTERLAEQSAADAPAVRAWPESGAETGAVRPTPDRADRASGRP
ncbi:hypothetical protein AB0G85_35610 [Streptomyces sioyaensis]|uniref:hypothetical protein n=1 Tax=Streptomyces sioyaensis TaxID=67364 RepID=UPI0033D23021